MAQNSKDAAFAFAQNVVDTRYDHLSPDEVLVTKKSIMDALGVMTAASGASPGCKDLVSILKESGGKEESTLIGFGGKLPCYITAFANGALGHILDYDDLHPTAYAHPTIVTLPAALAVAERIGKVNGKTFITAIALGNDMLCRLGMAVSQKPGWSPERWVSTCSMGAFSAAAAAGKLLGLDFDQMVSAFGIALSQAGGAREMNFGVGAELRGMYASFPNKSGVLAVLMAQRGITGPRNSLEGTAGFFNAFYSGEYDRNVLLNDIGKKFAGAGVGFKPWPSCGGTHAFVDATIRIVTENDIKPQDVENITVYVGNSSRPLTEPLESRRKPLAVMDAKYSVPFTVSVAVARRNIVTADFMHGNIKDPLVLEIAQKVTPKFDPAIGHHVAVVEIKTKDGKVHSKKVDTPLGQPKNPISMEMLLTKFRDCLSLSYNPIPAGKIEEAVAMMTHLEEADDVTKIMRMYG